jgi:hypothetical protein
MSAEVFISYAVKDRPVHINAKSTVKIDRSDWTESFL